MAESLFTRYSNGNHRENIVSVLLLAVLIRVKRSMHRIVYGFHIELIMSK
ncbi:hypothetical protein [Bacillus velezensis]|nr:hypothetical protein [Bacillus velezensis]QRL10334.1 hypothetical protein GKO36_15945 [Bacillus velezensis]